MLVVHTHSHPLARNPCSSVGKWYGAVRSIGEHIQILLDFYFQKTETTTKHYCCCCYYRRRCYLLNIAHKNITETSFITGMIELVKLTSEK